jgi:hypothetical protein
MMSGILIVIGSYQRIIELDLNHSNLLANPEVSIAGGRMSTIPGQKIEHNRDIPNCPKQVCAPPANHPNDDEVY